MEAMTRRTFVKTRRVVLACIVGAILAAIISLISIMTITAAESHKNNVEDTNKSLTKFYSSMVINDEDTLYDIARKYHGDEDLRDYISNIIEINNLNSECIYSGKSLVYYYYE